MIMSANNNVVLTWDYKGNNKYNKCNNVIINQKVPRETSKYLLFKIGLSHDINKDSFNFDLDASFSFRSIYKLSKIAL